MKGGNGIPSGIIHKRLYPTVLPRTAVLRPRSNSASLHTGSGVLPLSFFDSPPPPSSRLHAHPAPKPKQQSTTNPNPIALLSDHPDSTSPLHPQLSPTLPYPSRPISPPHPAATATSSHHPTPSHTQRPRNRYQLDVGAYGIPKRNQHQHYRPTTDAHLAVQIGEDAYFVRDNAMGVADGVGGWARSTPSSSSPSHRPHTPAPTPSAIFARRLMHYTSAQLDPYLNEDIDDSVQSLNSHLEDLEDGIDVLQILEHAYSQTVKAHVEPSTCTPLHIGSSTALVAVLDHGYNVDIGVATSGEKNTDASSGDHHHHQDESGGPVLKIAHVGDCMGMLVRGDEIVWRSEEMWWAFNTPVQLAPPPRPSSPPHPPSPPQSTTLASLFSSLSLSTPPYDPLASHHQRSQNDPSSTSTPTPRNSAQILTVPVQADDILILASDGLSDNLWDEDVLDEVVRFRKMYEADSLLLPRPHPGGCIHPTRQRSHSRSRSSSPLLNATSTSTSPHIYAHAAPFSTHVTASRASTPSLPQEPAGPAASSLHKHTLAAMLSEALCSRARRVSERRREGAGASRGRGRMGGMVKPESGEEDSTTATVEEDEEETPFARRAREAGRVFFGGKRDDISVLVAVVAPAPAPLHTSETV